MPCVGFQIHFNIKLALLRLTIRTRTCRLLLHIHGTALPVFLVGFVLIRTLRLPAAAPEHFHARIVEGGGGTAVSIP